MAQSNFYTENRLTRTPDFFRDPAWVKARLGRKNTRITPIWRNQNLILGDSSPRPVTFSGEDAHNLMALAGEIALLGLDAEDAAQDGAAIFVVDVSQHELESLKPIMGRAEFIDLRQVGVLLDRHDGSLQAHARGLMYWHRHNRYCSNCGGATTAREAGRMRRCGNAECGRDIFPRIEPAVIMLVTRPGADGGTCLLGRHRNLPEGMYSTLAGFVDQGETLEQTVVREVFEETAVRVDSVAYRDSQPWPFPASLMLGFRARAISEEIDLGNDELEDARWFTRAQLANLEATGIRLPRKDSIAHSLIREWLDEPERP